MLAWVAGIAVAPFLLAVLFIAIFGWSWLRGPIERATLERTGRALVIAGELDVDFGWPVSRLNAGRVSFANPGWAQEKQMVTAEGVHISIDLWQLLMRKVVLRDVALGRPVVFLEVGSDGRRNWLLDLQQKDEESRIRIDRVSLDHGTLGYDDPAEKTRLRAGLATSNAGLAIDVSGFYKGLVFKGKGNGGPVLALRNESTPYALNAHATVGRTVLDAQGTITNVVHVSAMDMQLSLHGDSLEELFPLFGVAFPATPAYATEGRLLHEGNAWRYERFSGRIGSSDIAGRFAMDTGGKRPVVRADLDSKVLDLKDLGPLIGAVPGAVQAAKRSEAPAGARLLPELPFNAERWSSVDAEVSLKASTIRRASDVPLENLQVRMTLRDAVLTLDPFDFGLAGGHMASFVSLNGQADPIQAQARVRVRGLMLEKLFPDLDLWERSLGELNGEVSLRGRGDSVRQMLATSRGKGTLAVSDGHISRLMMEKAGLHLWEILAIRLRGDQLINMRCAVANVEVRDGVITPGALVFDTEVTTITGTGTVDLGAERIDLTLNQKTKNTSPVAFRSPIHIGGSFAQPEVGVDKGRVAARAVGALALGLVSPVLLLLPLVDAGPGRDSDCAQLVREAKVTPARS